jgi:hypothetical protein
LRLAASIFHPRVLGRVESISSSDERDVALAHTLQVDLREQTLTVKGLVEVLSDATVSTIGTNKDIALSNRSVSELDPDTDMVLVKRLQPLGHVDLV